MHVINGSDRLPNVLARTGSGNGTMVDLSGKECCHHLPSQLHISIILIFHNSLLPTCKVKKEVELFVPCCINIVIYRICIANGCNMGAVVGCKLH